MALYRTVSMSFWTDAKVVDDFTPEDRYFYLYLFTNPHTNLCGCYEISLRQMVMEIGYSRESVEKLIQRFETVHNVVRYSADTKEMLLLNWNKYNWTRSEKFRKPLLKEIANIKEESFRDYLQKIADGEETEYGIDTTCTDTSDASTNTDSVSKREEAQVVFDLYNETCTDLPKVQKVTDTRIRTAKKRLDDFGLEDVRLCFKKAQESDFLTGRHGDFKASFDWLMKPANMTKVLEGNYDNRGKKQNATSFSNFKQRKTDYDEIERQLIAQSMR